MPAFLDKVPNDPITGYKLIYKPSQNGSLLVYGVGWDEIDNGGDVSDSYRTNDWGVNVVKRLFASKLSFLSRLIPL